MDISKSEQLQGLLRPTPGVIPAPPVEIQENTEELTTAFNIDITPTVEEEFPVAQPETTFAFDRSLGLPAPMFDVVDDKFDEPDLVTAEPEKTIINDVIPEPDVPPCIDAGFHADYMPDNTIIDMQAVPNNNDPTVFYVRPPALSDETDFATGQYPRVEPERMRSDRNSDEKYWQQGIVAPQPGILDAKFEKKGHRRALHIGAVALVTTVLLAGGAAAVMQHKYGTINSQTVAALIDQKPYKSASKATPAQRSTLQATPPPHHVAPKAKVHHNAAPVEVRPAASTTTVPETTTSTIAPTPSTEQTTTSTTEPASTTVAPTTPFTVAPLLPSQEILAPFESLPLSEDMIVQVDNYKPADRIGVYRLKTQAINVTNTTERLTATDGTQSNEVTAQFSYPIASYAVAANGKAPKFGTKSPTLSQSPADAVFEDFAMRTYADLAATVPSLVDPTIQISDQAAVNAVTEAVTGQYPGYTQNISAQAPSSPQERVIVNALKTSTRRDFGVFVTGISFEKAGNNAELVVNMTHNNQARIVIEAPSDSFNPASANAALGF
jgi:hypothetical protein